MALGINFIDMYTPNPEFRDNLGAAMAGRREKLVLQGHICAAWEDGQYLRTRDILKAKEAFEDQLKRLGTDYLDIGMIHYVDGESDFQEVFQGEVIRYCKELKSEGKIRAIGLSSHNPAIARKVVESGLIDVLMFSVNAAYDMQPASEDCNDLFDPATYQEGFVGMNPDRKALYELCDRENVAIDVMKAFGGGDMLNEELSPFGVAFNEYQCIEYCLTRPGVAAVMAGCRSEAEIEKAVSYFMEMFLQIPFEGLCRLVEEYYDYDGYEYIFLWISDFSSFECTLEEKEKFYSLLEVLNRIGKKPLMAYGGYDSILLTQDQMPVRLFGVAQSVGYGEARTITPVGGGLPVNKYYFYPLHKRMRFDEALSILMENGYFSIEKSNAEHADDYYSEICNCKQCQNIIKNDIDNFRIYNASIPYTVNARYGEIKRNRPTTEANLVAAFHFLFCKNNEWKQVENEKRKELIQQLLNDSKKYGSRERQKQIEEWCNIFAG